MSKFSEIVVSGDSLSVPCDELFKKKEYEKFGLDIENLPFEFPEYDCWPKLLGQKMNKKVVNLSVKGSGNYSMCKRAQDYIINNHKKVELCIIALSEWTRVEDVMLNRAKEQNHLHYEMDIPEDVKDNLNCKVVEKYNFLNDFYNQYNKQYFYGIFRDNPEIKEVDVYKDESKLVYNTLRSIYELQKICKELNIKCIFFQMLRPIMWNIYDNSKKTERQILKSILNNSYLDFIDLKNLIGWPFFPELGGFNIFEKHLFNKFENVIGPIIQIPILNKKIDYHPNQKGHHLISDLLQKELL